MAEQCCRQCGCTPDRPCRLQTGEECAWTNAQADLCNTPSCQIADKRRREELRRLVQRQKAELVRPVAIKFQKSHRERIAERMRKAKRKADRRRAA